MSEPDQASSLNEHRKERQPDVELYDPSDRHVVSQNTKNEFLKVRDTSGSVMVSAADVLY
ncbi:hypothetical protein [Mesorhizobium sp. M0959]|uniref:hypothetical protein n=1 Tax=unclassified Mesorhizobium TaxID=325217 RepID=UPI003336B44F